MKQARTLQVAVLITLVLAACGASAQSAGTVAEVSGQAEVGRGTTWIPATIGLPIEVGDIVRTGRPGKLRAVFADESVIVLGDDTRIVVDEHVFAPDRGVFRSLLQVIDGRVRALVSDYYPQPGASYQIRTSTAVAGVRGTEFIVAADAEQTEIIGINGEVEVFSPFDRGGQRVLVTARELSFVARGRVPTAPRRLGDDAFRHYLEGLEFIETTAAIRSIRQVSFVSGASVPEPDRAGTVVGSREVTEASLVEPRTNSLLNAATLIGQPPGPIQALSGRVRVEF